jgi:hypothetical protein
LASPHVKVEGLAEIQKLLKRYAPEVQKKFRAKLRGLAVAIAQDAKGRAAWSERIPGAIAPTVTTKAVGVRVSKKKAPHGGLFERGGSSGSEIRHPLFGNREFWFSQPVRPFLQPAVDSKHDEAQRTLREALDEARREVGLHD